jgi:hypothetical protein
MRPEDHMGKKAYLWPLQGSLGWQMVQRAYVRRAFPVLPSNHWERVGDLEELRF